MNFDLTNAQDRLHLYKKVLEDYQEAEKAGVRPFSMQLGICMHILDMKYSCANNCVDLFHHLTEIDPYLTKDLLYIAPPGELAPRIKILKEIISTMEQNKTTSS